MSTNIHLQATREITVNKTGKVETQTIFFRDCWQTPTEVTKKLLENSNPAQAYFDMVKNISEDTIYSTSHIKDVKKWIKGVELEGYVTEWVGW